MSVFEAVSNINVRRDTYVFLQGKLILLLYLKSISTKKILVLQRNQRFMIIWILTEHQNYMTVSFLIVKYVLSMKSSRNVVIFDIFTDIKVV